MSQDCTKPSSFTKLTAECFDKSLARSLVCTVDSLRDLYTSFGLRPYLVRIIRTKWSGGRRGAGQESVYREMLLEPTPRVMDLDGLTEILQPVGLDEVGGINVDQISGRYSEDELKGAIPDGDPIDKDENVFYEIEFPQPDGRPNIRRRFLLRSAPFYEADNYQWGVRLERSHEDRSRQGEPR